jgi:hypothetical protein
LGFNFKTAGRKAVGVYDSPSATFPVPQPMRASKLLKRSFEAASGRPAEALYWYFSSCGKLETYAIFVLADLPSRAAKPYQPPPGRMQDGLPLRGFPVFPDAQKPGCTFHIANFAQTPFDPRR